MFFAPCTLHVRVPYTTATVALHNTKRNKQQVDGHRFRVPPNGDNLLGQTNRERVHRDDDDYWFWTALGGIRVRSQYRGGAPSHIISLLYVSHSITRGPGTEVYTHATRSLYVKYVFFKKKRKEKLIIRVCIVVIVFIRSSYAYRTFIMFGNC